jgi:hypothetical protein
MTLSLSVMTRTCSKARCASHASSAEDQELWKLDLDPDGNETWTSYLGYTYTKKPAWFPLPEPLPAQQDDDNELADLIDQLPDYDPNPPYPNEPRFEPPPLTDQEYAETERAVDTLDAFGIGFREWCDRYYDGARATGLVT